jgi:hypothetical protein
MKTRRGLIFLLAGLGLAAVLGYGLRDPVRAYLILPLTKFFWLVRGYYGAFSQTSYWIILLVMVVLIGLVSFRLADWAGYGRRREAPAGRGAVFQMAFWLERTRRSVYARWYVARTLADLALDLIGERSGVRRRGVDGLEGAAWNPPAEIQEYLQSALRLSPAGFARNESSPEAAALEHAPEPVIAYLESILEKIYDHFHS